MGDSDFHDFDFEGTCEIAGNNDRNAGKAEGQQSPAPDRGSSRKGAKSRKKKDGECDLCLTAWLPIP